MGSDLEYGAGNGLLGAGIGGGVGVLLGGEVGAMSGAVIGGMAEDYVRVRYDVPEAVEDLTESYGLETVESFFR